MFVQKQQDDLLYSVTEMNEITSLASRCRSMRGSGEPPLAIWPNHSRRLQQTGNIATPKPEMSPWQPHIDLEGEKRNPEIYNLCSLSLSL